MRSLTLRQISNAPVFNERIHLISINNNSTIIHRCIVGLCYEKGYDIKSFAHRDREECRSASNVNGCELRHLRHLDGLVNYSEMWVISAECLVYGRDNHTKILQEQRHCTDKRRTCE